jgi:hypothetical protein
MEAGESASNTARPPRSAQGKPGRPRDASRARHLDYEFPPGSSTVNLTARIDEGWRFLKKVWGFWEQVHIESLVERRVRIQVSLWPSFGRIAEAPPSLPIVEGPSDQFGGWISRDEEVDAKRRRLGYDFEAGPDDSFVMYRKRNRIRYSVQPARVNVSVELLDGEGHFNPALDWTVTPSGAPRVHMIDSFFGIGAGELQLQVLIVARPAALRPGPIEWERLERHFVPGGLPSLGKHR